MTSEVVPQIRKTGSYALPDLSDPKIAKKPPWASFLRFWPGQPLPLLRHGFERSHCREAAVTSLVFAVIQSTDVRADLSDNYRVRIKGVSSQEGDLS